MRVITIVLALFLSAVAAGTTVHAAFLPTQRLVSGSITAADDFGGFDPEFLVYLVAIDTQPGAQPANSANTLGSIEPCVSVQPGQTFDIDIVIRSHLDPGVGIAGFQLIIHRDDPIVRIVGSDPNMFLAAGGEAILADFSHDVPSNDDNWLAAVVDLGPNDEAGDGVLIRLTVEALQVGVTRLSLRDLMVSGYSGGNITDFINPWTIFGDATIAVGQPCPDATPGPSATPAPTVSASATPSPATTAAPTDGDGTPTPASPSSTPTPTGTPTPTPHQATQPVASPTLTTSPTPTPTATPTPAPTSTVGGITSSPAPTPNLSGDAGCDGEVDLSDAIAILMYLGLDDPLGCPEAADVTCDNAITTDDLLALLKWRGGLPVSLPGGCPAIASS